MIEKRGKHFAQSQDICCTLQKQLANSIPNQLNSGGVQLLKLVTGVQNHHVSLGLTKDSFLSLAQFCGSILLTGAHWGSNGLIRAYLKLSFGSWLIFLSVQK